MIPRSVAAALVASTLALVGCSTDKPAPSPDDVAIDDLGAIGAGNGKADDFDAMIVGSLEYGQRSRPIVYYAPPRYRIVKFAAGAGDVVRVRVTSTHGDAMAWVLDDDLTTLAFNDDASPATLDARIDLVIPPHPSATHYIVLRDYWEEDARFRVTLEGEPAGCQLDADCAHLPVDPTTGERAQCDREAGTCAVVAAADIACGGHTINHHECAPGWQCMGPELAWDGTGTCVETCGGFAGDGCAAGLTCVDDPRDGCDVAGGGADCTGICVEGSAPGCDLVGCPDAGSSCQLCWGLYQCVPDGAQC